MSIEQVPVIIFNGNEITIQDIALRVIPQGEIIRRKPTIPELNKIIINCRNTMNTLGK